MAMKPANSFFQTLLGVIAYLFGLRDRGFDILNAFGIMCSVDQVRKHGMLWSKKRRVADEVNKNAFWRVSFDNLNFKMNLRMLGLCTRRREKDAKLDNSTSVNKAPKTGRSKNHQVMLCTRVESISQGCTEVKLFQYQTSTTQQSNTT